MHLLKPTGVITLEFAHGVLRSPQAHDDSSLRMTLPNPHRNEQITMFILSTMVRTGLHREWPIPNNFEVLFCWDTEPPVLPTKVALHATGTYSCSALAYGHTRPLSAGHLGPNGFEKSLEIEFQPNGSLMHIRHSHVIPKDGREGRELLQTLNRGYGLR